MPRIQLAPHIKPEDWQLEATRAWLASRHPDRGPMHGIFDVFTGAGKTIASLCCMDAATARDPRLKVAIIVPSVELGRQWMASVASSTDVPRGRIGFVGDGSRASFRTHDVVVYVLNSARTVRRGSSLCQLARDVRGHRVMLIVDECHRAGARQARRIFKADTVCRLGLSATAARSDVEACDELGNLLPVAQQPHGKQLGPVCFQLTFRMGRQLGMLPRYEIHHHGISLEPDEELRYENMNQAIRGACKELLRVGGDPAKYLRYLHGRGQVTPAQQRAAMALQELYFARKQFLYGCAERRRVAARIVELSMGGHQPPRGVLMFHERIEGQDLDGAGSQGGAEGLFCSLQHRASMGALAVDPARIGLHHSRLDRSERAAALTGLRGGELEILVAVKALQEGIDVPDVEMAVTVASTASVRQRIQTMGRILRPLRDSSGRRVDPDHGPLKTIHLIYVADTVDERIYRDRDWDLEMGADRSHWSSWPVGANEPVPGEPVTPDVDVSQLPVSADLPAPRLLSEGRVERRQVQLPLHPVHPTSGDPLPRGPWYDRVGEAFRSVARGDVRRARAVQGTLGGGRARHAVRWIDLLIAGPGPAVLREPRAMTYLEIMECAIGAWHAHDLPYLDQLQRELVRRAAGRGARLHGLAAAVGELVRAAGQELAA